MTPDKKVPRKTIKATAEMGRIMADHFYELDEASKTKSKKIAWCTSVGPAELLRAMGFLVYFPENHGAMLGATRMATELIPAANAIGFSPEICSYLTSDIGSHLQGQSPLARAYPGIEGPPRPDVLVYNTNQCRDVQDWFNWYGHHFKVPVLGIQTHRSIPEVTMAHLKGIATQMEALIPPLEAIAGITFDMAAFKTVLAMSRKCSDLWQEVLFSAAEVPSPLTFFDGTIHMGPAVVLRGTQPAVDYYKLLLAEIRARVANGVAAVEGETCRLYWDGMPIWGRLSAHSKMFAALNANVLASTYCNSWILSDLDPEAPFMSMAKAYTEMFSVRSEPIKESYIDNLLKVFKVDGIIYHDSKTCATNSNCRYGMAQRLEALNGIPSLIINGDLNDMRLVSDEQTITNVEAFIEQLEERR